VIADYRRDDQIVNFYAAYYGSQRKGVSPHSPQVCIPGGGWLITSLDRVPVTLADGSTFEVNRVPCHRTRRPASTGLLLVRTARPTYRQRVLDEMVSAGRCLAAQSK
jgi:EpsI family protein